MVVFVNIGLMVVGVLCFIGILRLTYLNKRLKREMEEAISEISKRINEATNP